MASGTRDFAVTFGGQAVGILLNLATQSCLAWVLGPEDRGAYAVCVVFASLLTLAFTVGCDAAGSYYVASKRLDVSEGVASVLVSAVLACLAAVLAGILLMHAPISFVQKFMQNASPSSFRLALVMIPTGFLSSVLFALVPAVQEFLWYAIFSITGSVMQLGLTVLLVWVLGWGVNGALLASIANSVLLLTAVLAFLRVRHGLRLVRPSLRSLWGVFHYGARYYVGKLSNEMNVQIGPIILAMFATRDQVGLFAVAAMLTTRVTIIPDALGTVLFPRVAADSKGRPELVAESVRVVAVVCGAVLGTIAVFARPITMVLFSPKFLPIVPLVQILCAGVLIRCFTKVMVPYLGGIGRPGIASVPVGAGMAANLTLLLVLMPVIGLPGAAVAMAANYLVSGVLLVVFFVHFSRMPLRQVFRFRPSDWGRLWAVVKRLRQRPPAPMEDITPPV